MKKTLLLIILAIILIPTGCKKKEEPKPEPPKPNTGEVIVADNTKVMDLTTRQAIASIDTANYTFVFNTETDFVKNLKVGDILVDSTSDKAPYGYLRKVVSIEGTKSGKTVKTGQAKLTDAVLQGKIDFSANELPLLRNRIRKMVLAPGVKLRNMKNSDFAVFSFDYDVNIGDGNNKVNISGNSLLDMGMFFNFEWSYQLLPYPVVNVDLFKAGVELNQQSAININCEAGATLTKQLVLGTFYFDPWTFSVGPVPVVFFPKVELMLGVDGQVSAVFSTGASEEYHGALGLQYTGDNGWGPLTENNFTTDYYAPSMQGSSSVKAQVGPKVSLMLYNVLGPYMMLSGCAQLQASYYASTGNWDLDYKAGADATVGIEVDLFSFEYDWHKDFCLFKQSLMHLEDEPMETGIFFKQPVNGNWYALGSDLKLQASVTGATPDNVVFYADGNQIGSASSEPYEFVWNTDGESHGSHTLIVTDVVNGEVADADTVTIDLLSAKWETVDFSSLGQNNETYNYDVYFDDEQTGYIAGGSGYGLGGYFLKTTDGGQTWINTTDGEILPTFNHMLRLNENDYVLTTWAHGTVFQSGTWDRGFGYYNDFGNWTETYGDYDVYNMALSFNGYIFAVSKKIINDNYVLTKVNTADHHLDGEIGIPYAGSVPKVYFYKDKGLVFNLVNPNNILRQYYMISYDNGSSWETRVLNVSGITPEDILKAAFFISDTHGWIAGNDSNGHAIVLITNDGGESWEKVDVNEPYSFGSINFINDNEGYATVNSESIYGYENNKLYHTQDGGYTWEAMDFSMSSLGLQQVRFLNYKRGFAVGHGTTGYRFSLE